MEPISGTVSVIIATKNRHEELLKTIESLIGQTHAVAELIVVDQIPLPISLPELPMSCKYIHNTDICGAAAARNAGMDVASGEIWLFLDDDVVLEKTFVEKLLEAYSDEITAVSGIITNYRKPALVLRLWEKIFVRIPWHDERQNIYWNAEALRSSSPIAVRHFTGALMSFRASAVQDLRFDSNLTGAWVEDIDFCLRLPTGSKLVIAPQARLEHIRSPRGRSSEHWLAAHAQWANYLRRRHYYRGYRNQVAWNWLNAGYIVAALYSSVRR